MPAYHGSETKPIAPSKAIPDLGKAEHLLRLLTPVVKGVTAKRAIAGLAERMESLGRGWLFGERGHAVQHRKAVSRCERVEYLGRDDGYDGTRCVEAGLWKNK